MRTTFDDLGASAVFCVQQVPTVVIHSFHDYEPVRVARIHAALWNQGLASSLFVTSGDTVRILSLDRVPSPTEDDFHTRCLVKELNLVADAIELGDLIYATESGRFWAEHGKSFDARERVDRVLLDNLEESHRLLLAAGLSADQAQALLVQSMFVAYLGDRGIIGEDYFETVSHSRVADFRSLLETGDVDLLERMFEALRVDFNGDLFVAPCSFEMDDAVPILRPKHLRVLKRFLSGTEELQGSGGQYRLWPRYDFKYIPVELLSAVQDRFLGGRSAGSHPPGAYYTPMFLVDTVISQVWSRLPSKVKDGAPG